MTVPVTDRKRPTSLDLGITSLVISGHSGKPERARTDRIRGEGEREREAQTYSKHQVIQAKHGRLF